jgi:hypothetical protein
MNRDVKAVRDLLKERPTSPQETEWISSRREATLAMVLAQRSSPGTMSPLPKPRRSRPVWLVPVAALSMMAALLAVQFNPVGTAATAQAATPQLLAYSAVPGSAQAVLRALASDVRALPASAAADGDIRYTRTSAWNLNTRVDGQMVTSVVLPEIRETWRAPDGSGRLRVAPDEPIYPSAEARRDWSSGAPPLRVRDQQVGPGEIAAMYPDDLSADPGLLRIELAAGHPVENGPYEALVAVADLYREQLPVADVRAAVLEVVAGTAGLQLLGETVDRAGRAGLAVGVETADSGLPTLHTLIFDQTDGTLLAAEQTLTQTAGKLNVPVPSVIGYTLYEDHGRVQAVDQVPPA